MTQVEQESVYTYTIDDQICWQTSGTLSVTGRGIDLQISAHGKPFDYETKCFRTVCDRLSPKQFAVGPHLLDMMFDTDVHLYELAKHQHLPRPDGMVFDTYDSGVILTGLVESKSRDSDMLYDNIRLKLKQFRRFVNWFREEKMYFMNVLAGQTDGLTDVPAAVTVPNDQDIFVAFMAPFSNPIEVVNKTEFSAICLRVPVND